MSAHDWAKQRQLVLKLVVEWLAKLVLGITTIPQGRLISLGLFKN